MRSRPAVALLAALTASCAAPLMKLPSGPEIPMTSLDGAGAYAQANSACSHVDTVTAEVALSGSVSGRRIRGRLLVGVKRPASARIEAVAPFGQPLFVFVAAGDDASLLLPRDERILAHSRPVDVLDAVAGIPLSAEDLRAVLTGCADEPGEITGKALRGDWLILAKPEQDAHRELYLHRESGAGRWRTVAELRSAPTGPVWRAEYRDFQNDLPRSIHLVGGDGRPAGARRFDVTLTLSQVETNVGLDSQAFVIQPPSNSVQMSLEELRQSGPLAPRSNAR